MSDWPIEELQGRESFAEWEAFFVRLTPAGVGDICNEAIRQTLGIPESLNFYTAAIKRMRDIAHLATAVTEEQRHALTKYSNSVFSYVEARFADRAEALERFRDAFANNEEFYKIWGAVHVRQWLYDAGHYDEYGAELNPPPAGPPTVED